MSVTRAEQGRHESPDDDLRGPVPAATARPRTPQAPVGDEALERVRARIRAASGAAEQARLAAVRADETRAEASLLRERLPGVVGKGERAGRSVRALRRWGPTSLWLTLRRRRAAEQARRAGALWAALAERDELAARIGEREARAQEYRLEALRLRAHAAALPRLLDQAADHVHRAGGPAAEALAAAEAGLEPVLRREADLDHAVRWIRWARVHVDRSLRRSEVGGPRRPDRRADPACHPSEATRRTLETVRDVFAVLGRALEDLGVGRVPLTVPDLPADLGTWFAKAVGDREREERVAAALMDSARGATLLAEVLRRTEADHTATRRVLDSRRAHWCALLRGE